MKKCNLFAVKAMAVCLTAAALLAAAPTALAAEEEIPAVEITDFSNGESASPQADQQTWVYRTYNGQRQKRLWSYSQNRWLTDWINID